MSWEQAHQAFAQLMNDPHSSPAFALRWADMPWEEQLDFALRFKRGNKAEFERVLRAACLCDPLVIKRGGRWRWNIGMGQPFTSHALTWFSPSATSTGGDFVPVSPVLSRCFQTAWNYFSPFNDDALLQKHSCIDIRHTSTVSELWIEPEAALAHERIEAALFLREWFRDHVAPQQREGLCPEPLT